MPNDRATETDDRNGTWGEPAAATDLRPPDGAAVSIIVRFRNEAAHIGAVLDALRSQRTSRALEVIAIDNGSTDRSREVAQELADVCLEIDRYRPGAALNLGAATAHGDLLVALSAHAIPANDEWLETLLRHHREPGLVGAYGSQRYTDDSRFLDRKDLDLFRFGPARVERCDSDFWNACSYFSRAAWKRQAFDEQTFELEDHEWSKRLLPLGFHVRYEPAAAVYHYGHETRNDRVLPDCPDTDEAAQAAVASLSRPMSAWATKMDAVLRIKTLAHRVNDPAVVARLRTLLRDDDDFDIRWRVADALSRFPQEAVAYSLATALADRSFYVRDEAAWSLIRLGHLGAGAVSRQEGSLSEEHRHLAALVFGLSGTPHGPAKAVSMLEEQLTLPDPLALDALYVIGELAELGAIGRLVPAVAKRLGSTSPGVARTACWALGLLCASAGTLMWLRPLVEVIRDHADADVRAEATTALSRACFRTPASWALRSILEAGSDRVGSVRFAAVHGARRLSQSGQTIDMPVRLDDPDHGVRYEARLLDSCRRAL